MGILVSGESCVIELAHHDACSVDDPSSCLVATSIWCPRLLFEHLLDCILAAQPHASTVDGHFEIKVFRGKCIDSAHFVLGLQSNAGIIENGIKTATEVHCFLNEILDLIFLGDIAGNEDGSVRTMLRIEFILDTDRFEVGTDYACSCCGELECCCLAKARRSSSDCLS